MSHELDKRKLAMMEERLRQLAKFMDAFLNPDKLTPPKDRLGFAAVFSFDGAELTWVSNSDRATMIKMLKELIQRWESGNTINSLEQNQVDQRKAVLTAEDIVGGRR